MSSHIHVTASIAESVTEADVYAALRSIGTDDLSTQSPVTAQVREASVVTYENDLTLRVEGHDGEWSLTSQETLTRTLAGIDGVDAASIEVVSGGYDEAKDGDAAGEADDAADVETIDGVGAGRAETLRAAGIETVGDVLDVGAEGLVDAGLSEGVAENIVESA